MEFASFRLRSQGTCSRINQCQHTILTLREEESMRDGGRERMLTAFKTPMGILCHCILSPLLLASTISRHSVCVCVSLKPLRADQSPFAASAPGCFSHRSTIRSSLTLSFIPHFHFSPILHPTFSFFFSFPISSVILFSLASSCVELPTVFLSCHLPPPSHLVLLWPTTSSLLLTPLLLTGRGGGGG